jgi:amino acid adenylation domain-containing protein
MRIAASFEGDSLSYAALHARASALACRLRHAGARRGAVIAVCMPRSLRLLVALLAVQESGAAYLPLDPDFPAERLNYMLADSGALLVLQSGGLPEGMVPPLGVEVLDVEAGDPVEQPDPAIEGPHASDPAYVLYTSGSTGRPKGVVVPHGALANFLLSMREEPGLAPADIVAAVTTISFDIAGLELYLPLTCGARIELVSRDTATDGTALAQLLDQRGVTLMQATPATWRMLLEAGWQGRQGLRALCGGEALSRRLADEILDCVDELWNMYGPTETTIWSTLARVSRDGAVTIGHPIANTQVHIRDAVGNACPIGVAGEICIGGDGVALGYHARPALTADRFIADADGRVPGQRLYRTGDLGRWGADGQLQHLGRLDHQVKVRGFRIELGEIEQVLCGHPAVQHAVAAVREARADDQRLVAYVVHREGEEATASELKRFLRERLPEYAVPSIVLPIQHMPLTPNGKVDRASLPDPFTSDTFEPAAPEPLATPTEQMLADAWMEVLRVTEVGPNDNFFDLGGHSLLSLRVSRLLEKQLGRQVDPRLLFFGTLRDIGRQLDEDAAPERAP